MPSPIVTSAVFYPTRAALRDPIVVATKSSETSPDLLDISIRAVLYSDTRHVITHANQRSPINIVDDGFYIYSDNGRSRLSSFHHLLFQCPPFFRSADEHIRYFSEPLDHMLVSRDTTMSNVNMIAAASADRSKILFYNQTLPFNSDPSSSHTLQPFKTVTLPNDVKVSSLTFIHQEQSSPFAYFAYTLDSGEIKLLSVSQNISVEFENSPFTHELNSMPTQLFSIYGKLLSYESTTGKLDIFDINQERLTSFQLPPSLKHISVSSHWDDAAPERHRHQYLTGTIETTHGQPVQLFCLNLDDMASYKKSAPTETNCGITAHQGNAFTIELDDGIFDVTNHGSLGDFQADAQEEVLRALNASQPGVGMSAR